MSKDVNRVTVSGRLTKEPKLYNAGEHVYTLLRVAINGGKTKGGEDRPTIFYDVKVWNGGAKACVEYLTKGSRVLVEGRLDQYDRPDEDGQWNYLVGESVNFLDPAPKAEPQEAEVPFEEVPEPVAA